MDKNEAFKKIRLQVSKTKKGKVSSERRQQMVQGILDANINSEYLIKSEMPEEIMGVKVDWDKKVAGEVVLDEGIKLNPTLEPEFKTEAIEDEPEEDEPEDEYEDEDEEEEDEENEVQEEIEDEE